MKKILLIVFTLMFIATFLMAATAKVSHARSVTTHNQGTRLDLITFQETFENGDAGWTYVDASAPPTYQWRNYESATDGWVWWMGDPTLSSGTNIGGYTDRQYLVFDTPAVTVPTANPLLTFRYKYKIETPGTSTDAPEYNGWDSFNIRISIDNGLNWIVLTGTPAYSFTSSFAFGDQHGEGVNIPAWGGNSNGWHDASFDLSVYAEQSVMIRFAFASDPEECTEDDATLFGVMVDDISLGTLTNDGSTNTDFVSHSLVPLGGQLWHVDTVGDAPSPSHAMVCVNETGGYDPNMNDFVYSPSITLPASGQIKVDFQLQGSFADPDNNDFFEWDISPDDGITWYGMRNPYNLPDIQPVIYVSAPDTWASFVDSYADIDGMISDYAGQTVKFRWSFTSNATMEGSGIMIDDLTIYNVIFLAPPTNLVSTVNNNQVDLTWTAPVTGMTTGIITSGSEDWNGHINDVDAYAMKITNPNDTPTQLHGVNFILYRVNMLPIVGTPAIHVWADDAEGVPGTELCSVPGITGIESYAWKSVDITNSNIMIPANGSIFIGVSQIENGDPDSQGLLCDSTSAVSNSYVSSGGAWENLSTAYMGALTNCGLSGTIWVPDPEAPVLTGLKVYRTSDLTLEFTEIANLTDPTTVTYTDTTPISGQSSFYKVTGVYTNYESDPTNIVSAFVLGADYSEFALDDNNVNQGFTVGATHSMAVKFNTNPGPGHGSQIRFVKIYINQVGTSNLIVRLYNTDGPNGTPGTQLVTFTNLVTGLIQGWNTFTFPTGNLVTDTDGIFYIGILESTGGSQIGLDSDSHDSSWKKMAAANPWIPVTEGNIMIRAIVRNVVGNDDLVEVSPSMDLNNYPNPFNPTTTVSFNVPKAGTGSVKIYNVRGQLVRTLISGKLTAGLNKITWEGTNDNDQSVSSGIYFMKFETAGKTLTQKMILMK